MKYDKWLKFTSLWIIMTSLDFVQGARILALMAVGSKSHKAVFVPIMEELANRGHEITFFNPFPAPSIFTNSTVREISAIESTEYSELYKESFCKSHPSALLFWTRTTCTATSICSITYNELTFKKLLQDKSVKYDLVITDTLFNECMLPLVHHFQAPFVYLSTSAPPPWILAAAGAPNAFSYVPGMLGTYTSSMNFWERLNNFVDSLFHIYYRKYVIMPYWNDFVRKFLPDTPDIREIESNVSLVLTNTHPSTTNQFPSNPSIVEVGAMHCKPPKPLPQDLEDFVTGSGEHGFIIISFGSVLRGVDIPVYERNMFVKAFSRIPQRVIWKWETDEKIDGLSDNVRLVKWLPQQDLLGHEKVKAFITHGGLLSTQESVYHGCPIIGLPVFGDQTVNLKKAAKDGYAIRLSWDSITEDKVYQAIQTIIKDSSYSLTVKRLSMLLKDQSETPVQRAMYWLEYVIRHQGAGHLRSPARDLPFIQIYMIDLIAFVAILVHAILALLVFLVYQLTKWFHATKCLNNPKMLTKKAI